ncbi:MAG: DUF2764 domain-containing protein [Bacteroidales bacterium]|nr:DUF2764 domain-containing protein [Bacteroidales bacterium]MDD2570322.1 DUF2764 family protein [Bacteroidales bacterium]MDD2812052.1 DUF2764 family protein [Bacteroidales bacterium]MDD3812149.1 DUF2764 family protein [Bacteroidales bacterium]MDD3872155.1 DUF2764 family protein [Bacteroidales bacterium]
MFKRNYYYVVAGLADIIPDQAKLSQQLPDFIQELKELLHPDDIQLVNRIFLDIDNQNLLHLLQKTGDNLIVGGKYTAVELEQGIREPLFQEEYLNQFIQAFAAETPIHTGMSWEDQLTSLYYHYMTRQSGNIFLSNYYEFDQNIRNIITALNIRKYKLKEKNRFIGDNIVSEALTQSTLKDFGLTGEFPLIESLLHIFEEDDLIKRERAIDQIRWDYLDELNTFNYFTVEVILAQVIKLRMILRWIRLDEPTGRELFRKFIDNLNNSYTFDKEFDIKKKKSIAES